MAANDGDTAKVKYADRSIGWLVDRYIALRDELMSYNGVRHIIEPMRELFVYKGEILANLVIFGNDIILYLPLQTKTMKKYKVRNVAKEPGCEKTPLMIYVTDGLQVERAQSLIEVAAKKFSLAKRGAAVRRGRAGGKEAGQWLNSAFFGFGGCCFPSLRFSPPHLLRA